VDGEGCLRCAHCRKLGQVFLRGCTMCREGWGSLLVRCEARPELGLFEPTIRVEECSQFKPLSPRLNPVDRRSRETPL